MPLIHLTPQSLLSAPRLLSPAVSISSHIISHILPSSSSSSSSSFAGIARSLGGMLSPTEWYSQGKHRIVKNFLWAHGYEGGE